MVLVVLLPEREATAGIACLYAAAYVGYAFFEPLRGRVCRLRVLRASAASGPAVTHPTAGLSNVVHQRVRLGILTVLQQVDRADFSYLRERLELTDGNLSRNLAVLEESGYVTIEKTFEGKRPRTWVKITRAGTRALAEEMDALRLLLHELDGGKKQR